MPTTPLPDSAAPQYRRRRHVSTARQAETTVLLDVDRGRYYTLNEVGGRIWDLLEEGASLADITGQLAHEYDVPSEQLLADADAMLAALGRAKLIEASGT